MRSMRIVGTMAGFAMLVAATPVAAQLVKATQNTDQLTPYQVFELTFKHGLKYRDPTWDVTINVAFVSPSGKRVLVGGFFYGSSKPQTPKVTGAPVAWPCAPADLWKARYAPSEPGEWKFTWMLKGMGRTQGRGAGSFKVVTGRAARKGWLRINPKNPHRLIHEDGSPFFPVGFQTRMDDPKHVGSAVSLMPMEGPFALAPKRPKTPPGALFVRSPAAAPQNGDVYFGRHARAGFNLWRFSPGYVTPIKLFAKPEDQRVASREAVRWEQAQMIDEMLAMTRKYGIRNFYGLFGLLNVAALDMNNSKDPWGRPMAGEIKKVKRMIKYSVDRWGAYVDVWELLSKQKAANKFYNTMIPYLKSVDPYHKPISTSWERPELKGIDVNAPHIGVNEDELQSDAVVAEWAKKHKKANKIVIVGEQGNRLPRGFKLAAKGIGGAWDPGSARRMRVRCWSALFNEIALIFWASPEARDGAGAYGTGLWIGPQERQYVKALRDFARSLDAGVKMVDVPLSGSGADRVRSYGLRSEKRAAVYLHQFACSQCADAGKSPAAHPWNAALWDHDRGTVEGLKVTVDVPQAATGYWYSPSDASILGRFEAPAGKGTFAAPPFSVDLALLITEATNPIDSDGDGKANDADDDDDNDGVPDAKDAFPLEREESADADGDRIGDSLDADVDADGKADDLNGDGKPDNEELDPDGDGVPTSGAKPWDAFPRDPKETRDTDGDGVGDNADTDDDGDGFTDEEEGAAGTDPLSAVSFPKS